MNNSFEIQKLRNRRHRLMFYRQILTNRFDNKTTLSSIYVEMESYETKCAISTIKKVLSQNRGK